jgi:hypothetical protein
MGKKQGQGTKSILSELAVIGSGMSQVLDHGIDETRERVEGVSATLAGIWEDVQDHDLDAATVADIAKGAAHSLTVCAARMKRYEAILLDTMERLIRLRTAPSAPVPKS